jgi:signal recognition particle subunit SEC65
MNRYQNITVITSSLGIRYYRDSKYPRIPLSINDIYVVTTEGDRFDLLANQYYQDSSLWWIISIANENLPQNSLYIASGTQIRIPTNTADILASYRALNQQ